MYLFSIVYIGLLSFLGFCYYNYSGMYITSYNIRVVVFSVPLQELYKNAIL